MALYGVGGEPGWRDGEETGIDVRGVGVARVDSVSVGAGGTIEEGWRREHVLEKRRGSSCVFETLRPSERVWVNAPRRWDRGCRRVSLFVQGNGVQTVRIDEGTKLLAMMFFFQHRAAFACGEKTAGNMLEDIIRFIILRLGSKRKTATCRCLESLRLKSERATP